MSHVSERLRRTGFSFLCRIRRKSTKLGQKPYIEAKRIRVLQSFTVAECGFWLLSRYNRRRVQSWLVTRELSEFPRDIDVCTTGNTIKRRGFVSFLFLFLPASIRFIFHSVTAPYGMDGGLLAPLCPPRQGRHAPAPVSACRA